MNEVNGDAEQRDLCLARVLDEYVFQLRAGTAPSVTELMAQHPELAEDLEGCLACLDLIHQAGQPARDKGKPGSLLESHPENTALGDFRIVREVGKGGMGVVYEAEQLSLNRRVALKVLPLAAALDSRQLQRFKNEAQAAACLHHSNIVPVYSVGCDRGVHFYAMQFIDGQSLAEVISQIRSDEAANSKPPDRQSAAADTTPAAALSTSHAIRGREYFRTVARLGVQAAEALDHAHQQGIIHRDIKPANLLLDAAGHLWVTDFGLARFQAGAAMTATGGLVGTLRYMSPEQALAKRALVDHRSDIYSLGITLYEALTLQPAYPGSDRQELLRQIAEGEPKPPRRLRASIPVELETIVQKAMAREPEGRYQTAQEMADDLRRFLDGRPILASRPTLRERVFRWSRRHRKALAVALVMLLLGVVGLLSSNYVLWQEQKNTEKALQQAREKEAEAQKEWRRAEDNFNRALSGATAMLTQLDVNPSDPPPTEKRLRRAVIERGIHFFERFIDETNPDPAVRFQSSQACEQLACVYFSQHDVANGRAMMDKAQKLLEALMAEFPQRDLYRRKLIGSRYLLGLIYKSLGQPRQAREHYLRAAQLCRQTAQLNVDAETLNTCAWFLIDCPDETLRDPELAVSLAERAVRFQRETPKYWNTLGIAYFRQGDWTVARSALETSMQLSKDGDPYDWFFLAMSLQRLDDAKQARVWRDKAVEWMVSHNLKNEDLERYRTEANALIGH